MTNIAFTICSNNYLAQAKVLSDSVFEHNSENYRFFIVLCDLLDSRIDYNSFHATFIQAKDLGIGNFDWMIRHYDIIELNTAVKPFAFEYLIDTYKPTFIHYLDPDTCVYQSLGVIEEDMQPNYSILLTPHAFAPLPFDGKYPTDNIFLNFGIYNLGFLGLKVSDDSKKMIEWWKSFLLTHCLRDTSNGFFVDQLPMTLAPLYFEGIKISRHKGVNVAYWNLHERNITQTDGQFIVDGLYPLVMYHFSHYHLSKPDEICLFKSRIKLKENPVLASLFHDYGEKLSVASELGYSKYRCKYVKPLRNPVFVFLGKLLYYISIKADKMYWLCRGL